MESSLQERAWIVHMACTFEFLLHFVRCDLVTVSPNQIFTIIIKMFSGRCGWHLCFYSQ